mmetsp:Transcript_528/g.1744  ORF Transcript_528/g.1744 Transcript_528/m.1744 type:complete len:144 (-) Transcript_528:750-1181(-)|eukprot:scaffold201342_cov26-Tisochrysis_lutea.AAC.1
MAPVLTRRELVRDAVFSLFVAERQLESLQLAGAPLRPGTAGLAGLTGLDIGPQLGWASRCDQLLLAHVASRRAAAKSGVASELEPVAHTATATSLVARFAIAARMDVVVGDLKQMGSAARRHVWRGTAMLRSCEGSAIELRLS